MRRAYVSIECLCGKQMKLTYKETSKRHNLGKFIACSERCKRKAQTRYKITHQELRDLVTPSPNAEFMVA